jgi:hypothetical protein
MSHPTKPPILLDGVFEASGLAAVRSLLERGAPYTPLGGWNRPGLDPDAETSVMWFQQDWVHADYRLEGAELFLDHPAYAEHARRFWGAEEVIPHSVYVNLMANLCEAGPAHTDNPKFRGRERKNTPMWLLRLMFWSGLFERWSIPQATAIFWLDDVEEGGGLTYWADGPDKPARRHFGQIANTALVGDNHFMFHQVEPVGPFGGGTRRVTARAELAPSADASGDWVVRDRGREIFRAPLSGYRVSVLWKADVHPSRAERLRLADDVLSLEDVAAIFNRDLARRGETVRFDLARFEDPRLPKALSAVYRQPVPLGARPSIYDYL